MEKLMAAIGRELTWGVDYRKTRVATGSRGERWLTTLTRLNDGRLLASWESDARPAYRDVRQVLSFGLLRHAHPQVLWCDAYLAEWCEPLAEQFGIVLCVRQGDMQFFRINLPEPAALMAAEHAADGELENPEAQAWFGACLTKVRQMFVRQN